jgi:hypothetical protein
MIIWLASYPKSGNTWLRAFISSLLYSNDGQMKGDLWEKIDQFPTLKHFNNLIKDRETFKLKKRNDVTNLFREMINAQDFINLDNKIKFLKTHFLNCKIDNYNFTNQKNTLGIIHIVRDPRNVITSLKNHYDLNNINESYDFLTNNQKWIGTDMIKDSFVPTLISSWDNHYNLWKQSKKNYLLVKYENLIIDSVKELRLIKDYIESIMDIKIEEKKFMNAVDSTNFENLKKLENDDKFDENTFSKKNKKIKFFNLGIHNNWEKILDNKIKLKIENKFHNEMKELGYI